MTVYLEMAQTSQNPEWFVEPIKDFLVNAGLTSDDIDVHLSTDMRLQFTFASDMSPDVGESLIREAMDAVEIDKVAEFDIQSETASVDIRFVSAAPINEEDDDVFDAEDLEVDDDEEEEEEDDPNGEPDPNEDYPDEADIPKRMKETKKGLSVLVTPEAQKLVQRLHNMSCGDDMTHYPSLWQDVDALCSKYRGRSGYKPNPNIEQASSDDMMEIFAFMMAEEIAKKKGGKKKWKEGYGGFLTAFMTVVAGKREAIDGMWTKLDDSGLVDTMIQISQAVVQKLMDEREKRGMDTSSDEVNDDVDTEDKPAAEEDASNRQYFVLAQYMPDSGRWEVALGDHERKTVVAEMDDKRDHDIPRSQLKIVSLDTADQKSINDVLERMNSE